MNKKSQINFGETFGIISITFIIIFIGLLFFNNITKNNIEEINLENKKQEIYLKHKYISNLEYLKQTKNGIIREEFDLLNLKSFSNILNDSNSNETKKFKQKFGFGKFQINIFDENNFSKINETIIIYNHTTNIGKFDTKCNIKTLISIYDKKSDKIKIGIFDIIFYKC